VCSVDKKAYQKRPIKKAINGIWLFWCLEFNRPPIDSIYHV
jgi:hypothetical protein